MTPDAPPGPHAQAHGRGETAVAPLGGHDDHQAVGVHSVDGLNFGEFFLSCS